MGSGRVAAFLYKLGTCDAEMNAFCTAYSNCVQWRVAITPQRAGMFRSAGQMSGGQGSIPNYDSETHHICACSNRRLRIAHDGCQRGRLARRSWRARLISWRDRAPRQLSIRLRSPLAGRTRLEPRLPGSARLSPASRPFRSLRRDRRVRDNPWSCLGGREQQSPSRLLRRSRLGAARQSFSGKEPVYLKNSAACGSCRVFYCQSAFGIWIGSRQGTTKIRSKPMSWF